MKILESQSYGDYEVDKKNILYKQEHGEKLFVVPASMQRQIIKNAHENGHFSVKKTKELLRRDYYIPSLEEKIKNVILNCIPYILAQRQSRKQKSLLNPIEKGEVPLQIYHVDHLGPMIQTGKGYKYLFVLVDAFSKFVWLYPTKTTSTKEVLENRTSIMEAFHKIGLLDVSLVLYQFLGETKPVVTKKLILFRIFNCVTMVFVLGYIFLNFFYVPGEYYVKLLQPFFSLLQIVLKYALLITQAPAVRYVLNNILTKFWDYRYFDDNVRTATDNIYKTVKYVQTTVLFMLLSGVCFYLLKPVILSTAVLPIESYIPESTIMFALVASSQFYCIWIAAAAVLAYDFVYVACCIHIILQLRLLKQKFKDALDKHKDNTKQRLCYYVKHHQFLYSIFHRTRNIFSVMLLFHYLVTLTASCFVLLQLLLRDMDALTYTTQVITIVFYVIQFALYTFPAEEVAFEFLDVPNAIYSSKWYRNEVCIQKLILYVMMKSQQQKYFTGAGLVDINVETFDSVLRKALSFCAIFKNLLKN
ncbi:7tm Odorant receptor [Popillia japonica]|uniref:7tm Odorant receptor n=1 Tax=Popillia japonica TaxID=7064 RepID=A0AAW1HWM5_POPJA